MIPVSAAMLKNPASYDQSLEAFSRPLLRLIDYKLDHMREIEIQDETAHWYRYIAMTAQAEALTASSHQPRQCRLRGPALK
jgi:hypothetical protein